jgi:hypothetical protein
MNLLCAIPAAILLLLACQATPAGEEPPEELVVDTGTAAAPGWTRLVYTPDPLPGMPAHSLALSRSPAAGLDIAGVRFPADAITPFGARDLQRLTVTSSDRATGTRLAAWFDPATGTALQRDRLKTGADGSRKVARFGPEGAARLRLRPADRAQQAADPSTWTDRKLKVFTYDLAAAGCTQVTVPVLLLHTLAVAAADTDRGYRCVFHDDALYRVWLERQDRGAVAIDFIIERDGTRERITGERTLETHALRVEPATPGADPAEFELLELRGAIAIHLDPATGLPAAITGSRGFYREIRLRLTEATRAE